MVKNVNSSSIPLPCEIVYLNFNKKTQYCQFLSESTFCDPKFTKRTQEHIILKEMRKKSILAVIKYGHLFKKVIAGFHGRERHKTIAEKEPFPKQSNKEFKNETNKCIIHLHCMHVPGNSNALHLSLELTVNKCKTVTKQKIADIKDKMFNTRKQTHREKFSVFSTKFIFDQKFGDKTNCDVLVTDTT